MPLAHLLLLAGQSNALGYQVSPAELPAGFTPDPRLHVWTPRGWEVMRPGVNTGTPANPTAWGPQVSFALKWRAAHPDQDLWIAQVVKGSTSLAADPKTADWSPESRGELFDQATRTFRAARAALAAAGFSPRTVATLWVQGEQDAADRTKAKAYLKNELRLFAKIKTAWDPGPAPILYARIAAADALPYRDAVRTAQDAAARRFRLARKIDTDGLPQQTDHLHFNGAGQLQLGEAAFAALQGPPKAVEGAAAAPRSRMNRS